MSLATRCFSEFPPLSKTRGQDYFRCGKVRLVSALPQKILARVAGYHLYETRLSYDFSKKCLYCHCTCPHFDDGNLCKHLWATVLTVDAHNKSHLIPAGRLDLVPHITQPKTPPLQYRLHPHPRPRLNSTTP